MSYKSVSRLLGLAVVSTFMFLSYAAHAAQMTWYMRKEVSGTISVTFYSDDRNHAWPGGDQVYVIRDRARYRYKLSCRSGEKICYGAWMRNNPDRYWGVGKDRRFGCRSCCYICNGGSTPTQVLQR